MVRVKQNNSNPLDVMSPPKKRRARSKYERNRVKSPAKIKPPASIKKYLQVVDLTSTNYRIDDFVCIQMFTPHKQEIITDQPCQITEGAPLTPHRIKLDDNELIQLAKKESNRSITEYFPIRRSNRKTKKDVLEEKRQSIIDGIKSEVEVGLEVRCFDDKGRGVVAIRKFNKGDFVVEYRGDLINDLEAKKRELMYANQNAGCYMYYFKHKNRQYCVDATIESTYFGRLVNHSRNGNLMTRIEEVNGKPHLVLIAKDDIEVGEEITYDYGDRSKESLKHHPWLAR